MNLKSDYTKYKKLAKILKILMRIFCGASITIAAAALLAWMVLQLLPQYAVKILSSGHIHISLALEGMLIYRVDPLTASPEGMVMVLKAIFLMVAVITAVSAPIFYQIAAILKTVEKDQPFSIDNSRRLTLIGAALIAGSIIIRLAGYFFILAVVNTYKLKGFELNYSYDATMMIMGFLIFILAGVFRYGSYLQQEYDETV